MTQSREHALQELGSLKVSEDAITALREALADSVALMVEESVGTAPQTWPEELRSVQLSSEDSALSPAEKLYKAQQLVIGLEYENQKEAIAANVDAAVGTLTQVIGARQNQADGAFTRVFILIIACVLAFAILMLLVCLLMRFWVVNPLVKFNRDIEHRMQSLRWVVPMSCNPLLPLTTGFLMKTKKSSG